MSGANRPVTLILPYYMNPGQLARQYERLAAMPEDIRQNLHLIVVDDGSPERTVEGVDIDPLFQWDGEKAIACVLASFQMFRIDVDVRWNWLAARNIGAHHAKTRWLLLTDIDHELPEATAHRIIHEKLHDDYVYRFSRVDAPDMTPYKPHPNSWFMTKEMYDQIGGYDERFSGFYGTDGEFRDRVRANAGMIVMLDAPLIRVPRELVPDASTTTYGRKEEQDGMGVRKVRVRIAQEGGRPLRLSFPYHQVV